MMRQPAQDLRRTGSEEEAEVEHQDDDRDGDAGQGHQV